jgi:hypothetical protein
MAVAACGGGSTGRLTASSTARLQHDVAMIRDAVGGRDQAAALARIESLRADIGRLAGSGKLARTDATVLQLDAAHLRTSVERRLRPAATTASTTASTTTAATTPAITPPPAASTTTPSTPPPAAGNPPAAAGGATPPAGASPHGHGDGGGDQGHQGGGDGQSNRTGDAGATPLINALIHGNGWGYLKHLVGGAYWGEIHRLAQAQDWHSLERLLQQYGVSGSGGGDGGD